MRDRIIRVTGLILALTGLVLLLVGAHEGRGEPMLGGIDNQENYDTLMKQIQSVIDADSAK